MLKKIYVSEKRVSVEYAYRMLQRGKLSFPEAPTLAKGRMVERLSETIELMLLGVAVPAVYVSELQDGSWLVLEATDRLLSLFRFLSGKGNLGYMDMYSEYSGMPIGKLEEKAPHVTSMIYDYKLQFQVIDYMTPRYLHLQVGSHVERWNFSREQGVRNFLYQKFDAVLQVKMLAEQLDKRLFFFSSSTLNRQYAILRIYMYRMVFQHMIRPERGDQAGLQYLLDQTIKLLNTSEGGRPGYIKTEEFRQATEMIVSLSEETEAAAKLMKNKGKEQQIRRLSYLYNLIFLVMDGQISEVRFRVLFSGQRLWERVERDDVNYDNISYHYDMILRDRGNP